MLNTIWKHRTHDDPGHRPRPAVYRPLTAMMVALGLGASAALLACQAPSAAPQPTSTSALPTATAIATQVPTATPLAPPTPTPTPTSQCPEDPRRWQLVEMRPFQNLKTEKPEALKPIYRIDPLCVYQGLWRDIAHILFLSDPPKPTVEKTVENVPWYWSPGTEFTYWPFRPIRKERMDFIFYNRKGERIDEVLTIYTVARTGDPDYPVIVYFYRDYPSAAYGVQWKDGEITEVRIVNLTGGTVLRRVYHLLYDARGKRWVLGGNVGMGYPRGLHATTADGSELWDFLGVRGFRRSELAAAFGMKEFFPERIDLKEWMPGKTLEIGP